jgi:hypothetical protein
MSLRRSPLPISRTGCLIYHGTNRLHSEKIVAATVDPEHRFDRRQGLNDPFIVPGAIVRHPDQPDWGLGQVQSAIGTRVTVNFEHAGKVVINAAVISLSVIDPETDLP